MEARKWKPGESGNPGGRPKKKPLTELYEQILEDPKAVREMRKAIVKTLAAGKIAMVLQLKEMAQRVEGRVGPTVEAEVSLPGGVGGSEVAAQGTKIAIRFVGEE